MEQSGLYEKGFNAGYWIAKHLPVLSETLVRGIGNSEHSYIKGFVGGTKEYLLEQLNLKRDNAYDIPFEPTTGVESSLDEKKEQGHSNEKEQEEGLDLDI